MADEWLKDELNQQDVLDVTPKDNSAYELNDEPIDSSITDDTDDPVCNFQSYFFTCV